MLRHWVLITLFAVAFGASMTLSGCSESGSTSGDAEATAPHDEHDGHDHADHEGEVEAVAADDDYPLTTCVVSGEPLDSMGGPIVIEYEGQTVKFCCGSCKDTFTKDPEKYLKILADAAAKAAGEATVDGVMPDVDAVAPATQPAEPVTQ